MRAVSITTANASEHIETNEMKPTIDEGGAHLGAVQRPRGTTERDAARWRELDDLMSDPEAEFELNHGGWLFLKHCIDSAIDTEVSK